MRLSLPRYAFVLAAGGMVAAAQEPARVAEYIRQLNSPKLAQRKAAFQALHALGERALPALRKTALSPPDEETRRRVRQLIQDIEVRVYAPVRQLHHAGGVLCLAGSPDGKTLASAGADKAI